MPQVENLVNKFGKMAGWNSATSNVFGRDIEGIFEVSYDDTIESEKIMGAGGMPVGFGDGNYEANCAVGVYAEEVSAILDSIPPGKRVSDAVPTDFIQQYEYDGKIRTDIIRNFRILGLGKEIKQGDKVIGQKLVCFCTHIDWNV